MAAEGAGAEVVVVLAAGTVTFSLLLALVLEPLLWSAAMGKAVCGLTPAGDGAAAAAVADGNPAD